VLLCDLADTSSSALLNRTLLQSSEASAVFRRAADMDRLILAQSLAKD
jgi:hypothetical protein